MSNLATATNAIARKMAELDLTSPLPVAAYFDEQLYQLEMETLFAQGPRYIGHELMVPNLNDYHVLEASHGARYLKRTDQGVKLFSNVCRHRQAEMLSGRGNASHTVCPLHRWTYDQHGQLVGAPHFSANPCLHLPQTELTHWNGLLFENNGRDIEGDLKNLGVRKDLDFSKYVLHSVQVDEYQGNWKTFIEVYLEDYHVVPFHPGLGRFVECNELNWEFGDWYSVQTVGVHHELSRPGSKIYDEWSKQVKRYEAGKNPKYGAIWLTYYPNITVEWYPHTLVISTIIPTGPRSYKNVVEFYYPEDIAYFEPEFVAAEQAAYAETAVEDVEIINRMEAGRTALFKAGRNEVGPYQSPMEDGMRHFHQFLRRELGEAIDRLAK
ncbi:aromatic ring-hydroxylating oxygenase subunit alpha [Chitinibacter tainanensis]|uniref:aromatic ring-hydroxylating oxygenase subunit alpha n=1 Tax=Chitinibacter tainanensis TaxID=230667 RepID=UPI0003F75F15|nr:aromatic ring-hydroxylating dioxygenase subunit alpha [Chitinibacter tainanensis]